MPLASCRYCYLYCPSPITPIWGHCAGVFPPMKVKGITEDCPFRGDQAEIMKVARARGFSNHDLRGLSYFAVSEAGIRTRYYSDLEKLREDLKASPLHYSYYVVFLDADRSEFYRAVIPEEGGGRL